MKMRLARPSDLVDINFLPGLAGIQERSGELHFGALARHSDIEASEVAARIPIIHDCAAGIADVQVRNQGTIGGSLAEADPSGDWAAVLLALDTSVRCHGPKGERSLALGDFIRDAYTTALLPDEVLSEVIIKVPPRASGGAHLAFKRSAPVYPTASAAVQLTMEGDVCKEATIVLGCVGLTPIKSNNAEAALRGQRITEKAISAAVESARTAAEPESDMRGSAEYKRALVGTLVKRAIEIAVQRAGGKQVEVSHIYA